MRELRERVRERLPELPVSPVREAEIVDELAELLRDTALDQGVALDSDEAVTALIEREIPHWEHLARELAAQEPPIEAAVARRARVSERRFSMSGLIHDLHYAFRVLRKSPVFTVVAVATLALAIGLNSAVFSLIDSVVLKPLPVEEPQRLVRLYSSEPNGFMQYEPMAYPDLWDLATSAETLDDVFGYTMTMLALDHGEEPEIVTGETVTGSYFQALGLQPAAGRFLQPEDDRRDAGAAVAVLSWRAWQSRFGGSPEAIGSEVRLNGEPVTIVGVAPRSFRSLLKGLAPELWIPMDFGARIGSSAMQSSGSRNPDLPLLDDRGRRWLWGGGRLAPGATVESAEAELVTLSEGLEEQYPDSNEDRKLVALPLTDVNLLPGVDEGVELASIVLMVVVGLVLLIACANLANMLLARALGRRREIATRLSVGASRRQVVRQLFVESLVLALLGGGFGLLLAVGSNRLLNGLELPSVIPMRFDLALDLRVVLFTLLVSTVTALVFGMVPALEVARTDLANTLREEGAARSGSRNRRRIQGALVVAQVALSVLLLIFAGLMVRSVQNAERIDPGFDPDGLVTAYIDPELQGYSREATEQLFERLKEEMASMPGVEAVTEATMLPLSLWINTWSIAPAEQRELPEDEWPDVDTAIVGPEYFETLEVPMLRGRSFDERDRAEQYGVAVVNEALARRFWPDGDAIGQSLFVSSDGEPIEVVGVVATGKYRTLGEDARPFLYLSSNQTQLGSRFLIARFQGPTETAIPTFRRAVRGVDGNLAMTSFGSVTDIMSPSFALPRLGFLLFGGFGLMGLLLASIGLYGLLAFTVGQRRHEIGIRMAMGADRASILTLVVRQGLVLTAIGAALGLGLALLGTRALEAVLYGISATDVVTFATVVAVMLLVALLACWLPARRAARLDPNGALRYD